MISDFEQALDSRGIQWDRCHFAIQGYDHTYRFLGGIDIRARQISGGLDFTSRVRGLSSSVETMDSLHRYLSELAINLPSDPRIEGFEAELTRRGLPWTKQPYSGNYDYTYRVSGLPQILAREGRSGLKYNIAGPRLCWTPGPTLSAR